MLSQQALEKARHWRQSIADAEVEIFGQGSIKNKCAMYYVQQEDEVAAEMWFKIPLDLSDLERELYPLQDLIWRTNDRSDGTKKSVLAAVDEWIIKNSQPENVRCLDGSHLQRRKKMATEVTYWEADGPNGEAQLKVIRLTIREINILKE